MADFQEDSGAERYRFKQKLRLNPCHLPQSVCYRGRASGRCFTAFLTERGVFIRQHNAEYQDCKIMPQFFAARQRQARQKRGKVLKVFSPQQFRGIAACKTNLATAAAEEQTAEEQTAARQNAFRLFLLHEEADYSVPLLICAGKDDVLLDWRLWADIYNLPMLIGEGGRFRPPLGAQALKLFINDRKMPAAKRGFSLRCHGLSLNTRLVLANQIMLG